MGNFIAWDARTGKIARSVKEQFSVWSGALATAGGAMQLLQAGVDCSVEGSHECAHLFGGPERVRRAKKRTERVQLLTASARERAMKPKYEGFPRNEAQRRMA